MIDAAWDMTVVVGIAGLLWLVVCVFWFWIVTPRRASDGDDGEWL